VPRSARVYTIFAYNRLTWMKILSRTKTVLPTLLFIMLCSNIASAGVVNTERSALSDEMKKKQDYKNASTQSRLRCWQKGSLLFDESGLESFSVANRKNVISFSFKEVENQSLHLVDLGETVCLFKTS